MLHRENQELKLYSGREGCRQSLVINNHLKTGFEEDSAGMYNFSFVSFCCMFFSSKFLWYPAGSHSPCSINF